MKRVIIVAGDDVVGANFQDIFSNLVSPGVLSGFNLSIKTGTLPTDIIGIQLSSGAGLLDSGCFIFNDETESLIFSPIANTNYTVLFRYVVSNTLGGETPSLSVEPGLYSPDTFTGGLILGWIKHGSGSLLQSEIIPARKVHLSQPLVKNKNEFFNILSPFASKWAYVSGTIPTITEGWNPSYNAILTTAANTGVAAISSVYHVPFIVPSTGLGQIQIDCEVPPVTSLRVALIDTAFVEQSETSYSASPMNKKIISIPQTSALVAGQMAFIKLTMNIQPGSFIKIKSVGYSSYTEPF